VRGELSATVSYPDLSETYGLSSRWPDDDCVPEHEPFLLDHVDTRWGSVSIRALEAEARELVDAELPLSARWLDGSDAALSLEWNATGGACAGRSTLGASFRIPATGRLWTVDGRLDLPLSQVALTVEELSGRRLWLSASGDGGVIAGRALEATAGIRGVDVHGANRVSVGARADFYRAGGESQASGLVSVDGVPACAERDPSCTGATGGVRTFECLYWPVSSGLPTSCTPL
jgi:hypothetical protein